MVGKAALTQSEAELEAFAAAGAQADAASGVPHSHFSNATKPVAAAETEVLDQPIFVVGRTVQSAMRFAIDGYYSEGPTGDHYRILTGPFSQVGCGVFIANQRITLVQDYR